MVRWEPPPSLSGHPGRGRPQAARSRPPADRWARRVAAARPGSLL